MLEIKKKDFTQHIFFKQKAICDKGGQEWNTEQNYKAETDCIFEDCAIKRTFMNPYVVPFLARNASLLLFN